MANKKLNAVITIGGTVTGALQNALGTTRTKLQQIGGAIRDLERQQKSLANTLKNPGDIGGPVFHLEQRYKSLTAQIAKAKAEQDKLNHAIRARDAAKTRLGEAAAGLATVGAVAAVGVVPIIQAAKFEKAMLGVAKQVQGARDANGQLTETYYEMARAIQQLGREIPISTNELADMVTAAARMDVPKEQLIEFTRVAAQMSTAFEMSAGEMSDNMGKIATIFGLKNKDFIKNITELGDTINYLDDNAISKGADIIKVMQGDLAGAASTMGLSAKNAAALASTFLTLGESAERADTAASGMLRQLQIAKMNPEKFQVGVKMIGMTADQLQKGMVKDPQAMILDVLGRIKKLPVEKQMEAVTRLFGKDWGGAIAKLANGVEEYRRQLELANGESAKGSMGREFAAQLASTNAQWEIAKNRTTELSVSLGTVLLPTVNNLLGRIGNVVSVMADWVNEHPKLAKGIAEVSGAILTSLAIWKASSMAIGAANLVLATFSIMQGRVAASSALAASSISAETAAMEKQTLAATKLGGARGLLGKALTGFVAADVALSAARAAGLPDVTDETQKRGEQEMRDGKWFKASFHMSAGSWLKAMAVGAPPAPPPLPGPKPSGTTINDNSKNEFHITQQQGESSQALADRVAQRMAERRMKQGGSVLYDKPRGY